MIAFRFLKMIEQENLLGRDERKLSMYRRIFLTLDGSAVAEQAVWS